MDFSEFYIYVRKLNRLFQEPPERLEKKFALFLVLRKAKTLKTRFHSLVYIALKCECAYLKTIK